MYLVGLEEGSVVEDSFSSGLFSVEVFAAEFSEVDDGAGDSAGGVAAVEEDGTGEGCGVAEVVLD